MKDYPVVDIYGRRTIECLIDCISKLNNSLNGKIIIKAYANNINRGVKIAHILNKEVGAEVNKPTMGTFDFHGTTTSYIEIPIKLPNNNNLKLDKTDPTSWISNDFGKENFINFSTYHLLLDSLFSRENTCEILTRVGGGKPLSLLEITRNEQGISYHPKLPHSINGEQNKETLKTELRRAKRNMRDRTYRALYRCGAFMPKDWEKSAKFLSPKDDVILGVDTNILYNCIITEHLLPSLSLIETEDFVNTPNWVLFIIPSTVMYELEQASNSKERGVLTKKGREAFRALQEVLEISQNKDIPGVSVLITGATDPILDMHNSLKRVSENVYEILATKNSSKFNGRPPIKSSSEDMIIRYQFREFLKKINFNKNTYFITGDKASSALATTEGLNAIYINAPHHNGANSFTARGFSNEKINLRFDPPIGSIVYEMAVAYGEIFVKFKDQIIPFKCDTKGDFMGRWLRKQLCVEKEHLAKAMQHYQGVFHLEKVYQLFEKMSTRLENIDWTKELNSAFDEHSISK